MSTRTTTTSDRQALILDTLIATAVALLLGFVLGFASEALAAPPQPAQVVDEAKGTTLQALKEARNRLLLAVQSEELEVERCLATNVMLLQGAWRTVSDGADDFRLASQRGDVRAAAMAEDRVKAGEEAGREVLETARQCDGRSARLARGDGSVHVVVTVNGVEDKSLGERKTKRPGRAPKAR